MTNYGTKEILVHKFSRVKKYDKTVNMFLKNLDDQEEEFLNCFLEGYSWKYMEYKYKKHRSTLWRNLEQIIIRDYLTKNKEEENE